MTRGGPPEIDPQEQDRYRRMLKDELRQRLGAVRAQVPAEARADRARRIAERLCALPEFTEARTVLAFVAAGPEVDPQPVVERARAEQKALGLPRFEPETGQLVPHHWSGRYDELEPGATRLPEPPGDAPRMELDAVDLCLVPVLGVDEHGHRVGDGSGSYDALLPQLPHATRCAIAYDFQLIAETPAMEGDAPVHCIITDERVIRVRST